MKTFKQTVCRVALILAGLVLGESQHGHAALLPTVYETPGAGGYSPWNHANNIAMYNTWRANIGEPMVDYREDWDSLDWKGDPWTDGTVFDLAVVPTAIFTDGVTFRNNVSSHPAKANDDPGSTAAIDDYAWDAHEDGIARMDLPNGADYLGFYAFDIDHGSSVTYRLTFTDSTTFDYVGLPPDEDRYRFIGFVNTDPTEKIIRLQIAAPKGSHYGIDEMEWGRRNPPPSVPEPATLLLMGSGALAMWATRRRTG